MQYILEGGIEVFILVQLDTNFVDSKIISIEMQNNQGKLLTRFLQYDDNLLLANNSQHILAGSMKLHRYF